MRTKHRRRLCILLPNKQNLDCTVTVQSRGAEVLSSVLEQLGLSDLLVLGLAVLRDNEYLFLDLDLKLSKYFGKEWTNSSTTIPFILFLRVKYYVANRHMIMSSKVQQLYYSELRQEVLRSQSRLQEALFFTLAASALQAEVGDVEQRGRRRRSSYFLPEDYFPSWLIKRRGRDFLLLHCPESHDELRGVTRCQAQLLFITEATHLQDVPVTFYRMRQEKKEQKSSILLGVPLKGINIYREVEGKLYLLYDLSWSDIDRFTFQGSRFEVSAVASLCLPKLVYHTHSSFHSKHVLRHLSDSHRLHMDTRDCEQLDHMQDAHLYREAYVCDTAQLRRRLHSCSLTSSMSEGSRAWTNMEEEEEEEEEEESATELCVDEPEELFVDDPAEVSWLAELLRDTPPPAPIMSPAAWTAVAMEMRQALRWRADQGGSVSVD